MDKVFTKTEKAGVGLMALITVGVLTALWIYGPIPQSTSYHAFADNRTLWGIPNFMDVASNAFFVLVGVLGLYELSVRGTLRVVEENKAGYKVFFAGVALVGLGSGYYHLAPTNATLVWDRIPMTVAFMALFSIIVSEFSSRRSGVKILVPLVAAGVLSVLYWYWTEAAGHGDLRPYILIQFLPLIVIPVILVCFPSVFTRVSGYWWLLAAYTLAKSFEHFDQEIFGVLGFVSGHTLKHLASAAGVYILLVSYARRRNAKESLENSSRQLVLPSPG
ncbi:MAG: ceramidase domain-containing protein [Desulfobacterales bacterium]